jgi:virulence factor Mce-like protein
MRIMLRAALIAGAVAAFYFAAHAITSAPTGLRVQAEFTDAHGLVVGNDVRIDGAPAGRVDSITLSDHGTAIVGMRLNDGLAAPRADATAAVRPVDLLGDTYVALGPGQATAALRGPIPTTHTLNDPRLDDLLRVFRAPQRAGLKAMLVELGIALDNRGTDLNQAALQLRPTLAAAQTVMQELSSQNADLRAFVVDADRVVAQGAARSRDLGTLINSLAATLRTTAAHGPGLDAGLATLPAALIQARRTAGNLAGTARAARPLAVQLAGAASNLAIAATRFGPFLTSLTTAAHDIRPTLRAATDVLSRGDRTLAALASGLRAVTIAGPPVNRLTPELVRSAPGIAQGFFVNFPDQATEPGTQPFDPFANPLRDYWRGAGVFSCQSFGLPIAPGCLSKFLAATDAAPRTAARADNIVSHPHVTSLSPGVVSTGPSRTAAALPSVTAAPEQSAVVRLLNFLLKP